MNHIGYLISNAIKSSAEEKAGWVFLAHQKIFKASKLSLLSLPDSLNQFDMLWWHYDSSIFLPKTATDASVVTSIKKYIEKGGALFLSLLAAQFVVDLGVEVIKPNYIKKGRWEQTCGVDGNPDIRGFSSFKGHPIFADLQGGVYTWNPKVGQSYSAAIYQAPVVPEKGQVIAVGRSYIRLNENRRLVLEYKLGKGKILTAGSFLFFNDQDNRFRLHLEKFTCNCIEYLLNGGSATAKSYWQFESPQVYSAPHSSKPLQLQPQPWKTTESTLKFESTQATDNFFDLGGRRILIMGRERAGISEVWCHPLRILRNLKLGFKINGSQIQWSDTLNPAITIRPESITRAFRIDDIQLEEIIFTALSAPCGGMHYKMQSNVEVELIITANIDLRFMWPYSPRCTGSLLYSWDQGLQAIVAKNQRGDFISVFGSGQTPDEYIIGQFADMVEIDNHLVGRKNKRDEIGFGLRFKLIKKNAQLTVVFSGSHWGEKDALGAYRFLLKNPAKAYNEQVSYFQ